MITMPQIGEKYERYIVDGSVWRHEVREIIDATDQDVLYKIVLEPSEGTCTQGFDDGAIPQHLTRKEWNEWAELARMVGS